MNINPRPYLTITNQGQTLPPFALTKSKHILGRDPQFADLLVPDDWGIISRCQATLIEHQGTYLIYDGDRHQQDQLVETRSTINVGSSKNHDSLKIFSPKM